MPSWEQLLSFAAASLVLIVAPGPDNLGVLSLGLSRGRTAGVGFALGCAAGCLVHTLLAAVGVTAAVAASLNNLGPGLGAVAANYGEISETAKGILCFSMLLGRLEILTVAVLLFPAFFRH